MSEQEKLKQKPVSCSNLILELKYKLEAIKKRKVFIKNYLPLFCTNRKIPRHFMFEFLHQKIKETIDISDEEFEFAKTLFKPKKLRKRRFLLEDGDVCHYTTFVEKGLLRSYTIDEKGNEHILQFAMQGWWSSDLYSFLTNEPSAYNIEALEDSELLLINKSSWDQLLENVPAFERYFRILIQNNLISTQRRLMGSLSETAEEKYQRLLADCPNLIQRVPQHMIASYIGITRETLSRIRSQRSLNG